MQLTAELSLYPLADDYIPVIDDFIATARQRPGVTVVTNAMSTQLCGDWDAVFELVNQALRDSHARHGRQVLVCKFIPGDLAIAP